MIYADYNGSAPLNDEVKKYLLNRIQNGPFANPNTIHSQGVKVKNASSNTTKTRFSRRAVAEARIRIHGKTIKTGVNIVDRQDMPYPVLIGRDVIHNNFLIDVSKTHKSHKSMDVKEVEKDKILEK